MRRSVSLRMRRFVRSVTTRLSSSLTRRIVVLNLGGLLALLLLFLYLNQFREGLIDARVQSLQTQGEIIAAAIAASATVETDAITVDPEKLLQLAPGQSTGAPDEDASSLQFSINPEKIGPVLRRLVSPTRTRARVFDSEGELLLDSRSLSLHGNILRSDLPPPDPNEATLIERTWSEVKRRFGHTDVSLFDDGRNAKGVGFPEVARALKGATQYVVRVNKKGETIVSVAVPIERFKNIRGALLLSTQGGDIDAIIASERWAFFRVFLLAAGVTFLLSLLLANTIAGPMRRLADAADRVRRGINSREEIPDFTSRSDEIGHLSGALRDMTGALYLRMEAIESFAADVAHELKNPLTSLRSAVETLPRIKSEESRERLMSVIQHDIRRLDRLISDISDASRLDAELARGATAQVDVKRLLTAVVEVANGVSRDDGVTIALTVEPKATGEQDDDAFKVEGHDSRLGQVMNNLIDNARSFSPEGGVVNVLLRSCCLDDGDEGIAGVEIVVEDAGPGIPADAFERIFERFYTDRPEHGFGQNSGLGLSISRQIIDAHGGRIFARNREPQHDLATMGVDDHPEWSDEFKRDIDEPEQSTTIPRTAGARFIVWLPQRAI
ncbi:stimulus-sensing domain-containing protein [Lichenihabitans psoromatis]|uniref:stimulus-sensing domain-containing protein n=1 Tax=Lichenihabitans psoromatis TaxID=2528642 RepID=UPI0010368848|nr:stimulus-sensing domain-containing protein [Lichenihabitans psoromatis]